MSRVVLVAASGLARETISSIRHTDTHEAVGVLDDDTALHGRDIGGVRVLGGLERAAELNDHFLVCAGPGHIRAAIVARLEAYGVGPDRFATHVDERADIGERVTVGAGTIILAGCVLTCDIALGSHVVLMPRVVLTHDDVVGDFATLAAGVSVGGRVRIGRSAYLGMNASVRQDLSVGEGAVLGMGGVLVRSLPDGQTWAGNPAATLPPRLSEADRVSATQNSTIRQEART
ncbi:NeuD/PglB/VioB family sugar acetyltransferase [Flaviflexus huanghaiensis]|uniref:NeuD/PglB/VioB family sugar acetyltransferase n=1 Tax=Flaviflexus huanghaiensis TaxID=1111473 RepID=UPI0015F87FFE|nr:NeuD/PglB/VioB family sugar acetyltransferase [Flaviflexus huanghaiensis]